jgi:membrane fusion protein, multidrug efflux system
MNGASNSAASSPAGRPDRGHGAVAGASNTASADSAPRGADGAGGAGGPGGRADFLSRLPPEVAAKVQAMSPDERRAWFQQRRAERAAAGN